MEIESRHDRRLQPHPVFFKIVFPILKPTMISHRHSQNHVGVERLPAAHPGSGHQVPHHPHGHQYAAVATVESLGGPHDGLHHHCHHPHHHPVYDLPESTSSRIVGRCCHGAKEVRTMRASGITMPVFGFGARWHRHAGQRRHKIPSISSPRQNRPTGGFAHRPHTGLTALTRAFPPLPATPTSLTTACWPTPVC